MISCMHARTHTYTHLYIYIYIQTVVEAFSMSNYRTERCLRKENSESYRQRHQRKFSDERRLNSISDDDRSWSRDVYEEEQIPGNRGRVHEYYYEDRLGNRKGVRHNALPHRKDRFREAGNLSRRQKRRRYSESSTEEEDSQMHPSARSFRGKSQIHARDRRCAEDHPRSNHYARERDRSSVREYRETTMSSSSTKYSPSSAVVERNSLHHSQHSDKKTFHNNHLPASSDGRCISEKGRSSEVVQKRKWGEMCRLYDCHDRREETRSNGYPMLASNPSQSTSCPSTNFTHYQACEDEKDNNSTFSCTGDQQTAAPCQPSRVAFCGVDLTVTDNHIQSIVEQLTGCVPQNIYRPAWNALSSLIQKTPGALRIVFDPVKGEITYHVVSPMCCCNSSSCASPGVLPSTEDASSRLLPYFNYVPSPSDKLLSETVQSLDPKTMGGVVVVELNDTRAASEIIKMLNGAQINGRTVAASFF